MRWERDMVPYLEAYFQARGYWTETELSAGFGVADLVAVLPDPPKVRKRLMNGQRTALTSETSLRVLEVLPDEHEGRSLHEIELADAVGLSRSYLKAKLLPILAESAYVMPVGTHRWTKINGCVPFCSEIIAVEAKKADWIAGASQARRYQLFAHETYLAILNSYSHRVKSDVLAAHDIGLITVSSEEVLLFNPQNNAVSEPGRQAKQPADRLSMLLALERIWERRCRDFAQLYGGKLGDEDLPGGSTIVHSASHPQ